MTAMTTTPGPRTAQQIEFRLGSFVHQMHPTKTLPEKEALQLHALLAEYRAAVEAEARADVDGLVALREAFEEYNGYVGRLRVGGREARNRMRALLSAGDKAEAPDEQWQGPEISLSVMAGDKAEAPATARDLPWGPDDDGDHSAWTHADD